MILLRHVLFASIMSTATDVYALDGRWDRPWVGGITGYFYRFTHVFNNQRYLVISTTVSSTPSRGVYIFDAITTLDYRMGALMREENGVKIYELDIKEIGRSMVPRTYSTAGLFWQMRECGITSWKVDVAVDISTKTCSNLKNSNENDWQPGVATYTIIGVSSDRIFLGDLSADSNKDGRTPSRRPQKLALDAPMVRLSSN